jgi:hypothetical protein
MARAPQKGPSARGGRSGIVKASEIERDPVKKPNYQFEKRQRELDKKKKKEEKTLKKDTATEATPAAETEVPQPKP